MLLKNKFYQKRISGKRKNAFLRFFFDKKCSIHFACPGVTSVRYGGRLFQIPGGHRFVNHQGGRSTKPNTDHGTFARFLKPFAEQCRARQDGGYVVCGMLRIAPRSPFNLR